MEWRVPSDNGKRGIQRWNRAMVGSQRGRVPEGQDAQFIPNEMGCCCLDDLKQSMGAVGSLWLVGGDQSKEGKDRSRETFGKWWRMSQGEVVESRWHRSGEKLDTGCI